MTHSRGGRESVPGQVFIRDGLVRWHATRSCGERDAREGAFAYHCSLDAAHRSPLVPCPVCAGELDALASAVWGPLTPHDRVRLPMPRLVATPSIPSTPATLGDARSRDRVLVHGGTRPPR